MLRPIIEQTDKACRRALEAVGFRRRYGMGVIDVNDEVVARVGLGRVVYRASRTVGINPVVAVAHVPLEMELASIEEREPTRRYAVHATIARPLGYLMPQNSFTTWYFSEDLDFDETASDISASVTTYGLPFIMQHQSLPDFYESMVTRRYGGIAHSFARRLPIAALMLGKPDEARIHVENYLKKLGGEVHFVAEEYRLRGGCCTTVTWDRRK